MSVRDGPNQSWSEPLARATEGARRQIERLWHVGDETRVRMMDSSSWADGLRGIATLGVVSSHLVLCFGRSLVRPCCGPDEVTPSLFQRPILRLISTGHSWVAVFFVLMGFVNSLKPLKQARSGQYEAALSNLASSSFRRTFRLILPSSLATMVAWMICQLGLMERGRTGDAWWLYENTPAPSSSWSQALKALSKALWHTWTFGGSNVFDQPQWTMIYLLQGSMMVFTVLLVVINLNARWRTLMLILFVFWSLNLSVALGDPVVGPACLAGIVLAELSLSSYPARFSKRKANPILTGLLINLGLLSMSVTHDNPDSASWCRFFWYLATTWFPTAANREVHRTWGSIGSVCLITGIIFSPLARRLLSTKPLTWLGKISFPVFLLHPLFMQTVMPVFAFSSEYLMVPLDSKIEQDTGLPSVVEAKRYRQRGNAMLGLAVAVTLACTLMASHLWMVKIEPMFGRVTRWCEDVMTGKHEVDWSLPRNMLDGQTNGHANGHTRVPSPPLAVKEAHVS